MPKSKSPKSKSDENVSENGTTTPETSEPAKTENAEEESTEKAQEQHPEEERPPAPAAEDPPGDTESVSEDIPAPASPAAETTVPVSATPPNDPKVESAPAANSPAAEAKGPATASMAESSIRVDVSLLDKLMNLVEELVLSRNQIVQFSNVMENNDLTNACQVFSLVTSELQEGIMKTRMQPVSTVLNKFPRIVRDMARACEKEINFKLEGEETELDKTIIEAIKDPLTHIIRNSVDHGIEKPADRLAAGKPESGKLLIRAFHEGGQVVIEIIDDGSGINSEKVKAKAIESGVVSLAQANEMPPPRNQPAHFPAGLLDRRGGHKPERQGRRNGCRENQYRKDWRSCRSFQRNGERDDPSYPDSAHVGDRPRAYRLLRGRSFRDSPSKSIGAGQDGR